MVVDFAGAGLCRPFQQRRVFDERVKLTLIADDPGECFTTPLFDCG